MSLNEYNHAVQRLLCAAIAFTLSEDERGGATEECHLKAWAREYAAQHKAITELRERKPARVDGRCPTCLFRSCLCEELG